MTLSFIAHACLSLSRDTSLGAAVTGRSKMGPRAHDGADNSLYCWTMELHDFPESKLSMDMVKYKVHSIM